MSRYTNGSCIQSGCKFGPQGPTGPAGKSDRYLTNFSAAIAAESSMDYFTVETGLSYVPGNSVYGISADGTSSFTGIVTDYDTNSGIIGIQNKSHVPTPNEQQQTKVSQPTCVHIIFSKII